MKRYLRGVLGLVRAYQKRFYRDKTALFFTFLFPLIFLFVFGSMFNNQSISFKLAILDVSGTEFSRQFIEQAKKDKTFNVDADISDIETAKQKMSRGEIDSILELPKGFGEPNQQGVPAGTMNVYVQKGSEQSGQTIAAVMRQLLDSINQRMGRPEAALKVAEKSTDTSGLSSFDYTFSGLLGFSIMSMGIFGLASSMPQEKQRGAFRRLRASPFTAGQLIIANAIHYLVITFASVLAMIVVGLLVFKFNMRGEWLTFTLFAGLSSIMIIGFGLLIGAWAKNENQAAPLSNLVSFPMMFLSGTFFPRFLYPEWLQHITAFVPLTPVVDGLRRIMTENASLIDVAPEVGIIGAWALVVYVVGIKLFRWE